MVGSLISIFVGATGTILAPFIAGVSPDRREFVATNATLMVMVHGFKVITFGVFGFAFGPYVPLLASMIAIGFLGNWAGHHLLERMPETLFRRVFQIVLTFLSLRLLYAAGVDAGYLPSLLS
jgi:uncharacterized membrane protein YfcA